MQVKDLYAALSYGDLGNLHLGVESSGTIAQEHRPRIISLANDALVRLYTRFLLSEKTAPILLEEGVLDYEIADGDLLKILAVYTESQRSLPISGTTVPYGIYSPRPNSIHVPFVHRDNLDVKPGSTLTIVYQAKHPRLQPDDLEQQIDLPVALEEALPAYIAARIYGGMNNSESLALHNQHMARFQALCMEAEETGQVNTGALSTTTKFRLRGWV